MTRETGNKVARLAARFLSGELKKLTREQQLSVCASCVSQAEREQESVKAWANLVNGKLDLSFVYATRKEVTYWNNRDPVVPVLITRADKRTQARKRK